MMKKVILMLLFCMVFVTGCNSKTGYDEISYNDYKKLMSDGESFALVIGSSTCSACAMFKGTMETFISEYHVDVKYIDISKLSEEDYNLLMSEVNFSSTPTTIFVKDGKHISSYYRIIGADSYSNVVSAYKRMGYIGG